MKWEKMILDKERRKSIDKIEIGQAARLRRS
jgi:hypothetical protein